MILKKTTSDQNYEQAATSKKKLNVVEQNTRKY